MSRKRSTLRILILIVAATWLGGLLFAQQSPEPENDAPISSPSDKTPTTEDVAEEETVDEAADSDQGPTTAPSLPPGAVSKLAKKKVKRQGIIASLTIFVLAIFVGFEVITKVPTTLHTPLMSGSNAISGITLVGAVIVASALVAELSANASVFSRVLGFFAVALATINVVGGFLVTHRMLQMFKRK